MSTTDKLIIVDQSEAVEAVNAPMEDWGNNCHSVSLAIVKAGLVPGGRIARGWCEGVLSQHSWIVVGDPYHPQQIIDPTLFAWRADVEGIWHAKSSNWHHPHGEGSIWFWGRPYHHGGETIDMDTTGMSVAARAFLDMVMPLDYEGWAQLLHAPVEGWPAGEIIMRAEQTPQLKAITPIDRLGMLTDLNPKGLYW